MVNRSNFPTSVDQFSTLVDILASDKTNVERYQTLLLQATRTSAEETEFTNLKNALVNKIISSEHLNFIHDSITSMQDYYLNEVVAHLATLDVGALQTDLGNHKLNTSNPHSVTKAQVGLGNVDNVKQATKTEFTGHVNNNLNPHNTTASQVGALPNTTTVTDLGGLTASAIGSTYAKKQQENWIGMVCVNGWISLSENHEFGSYRKNDFGMVEFRGVLKAGVGTDGTTIFTLPAGYRPERIVIAIVSTNDGTNDSPARVHIEPNGAVKAYKAKGGHFQIGSVSFYAYQ